MKVENNKIFPVENGKLKIGFFTQLFSNFNLSDISNPFGNMPSSKILYKSRLRNMMTFVFNSERYICKLFLFSSRCFYFIEAVLWDKKTQMRYAYRKPGFFSWIRFPKYFLHGTLACRTRKRYLHITTRLDKKQINMILDFVGDSVRPDLAINLSLELSQNNPVGSSFANHWFLCKSCMASMQLHGNVSGSIKIKDGESESYDLNSATSTGILDVRQGFFPLKTRLHFLEGTGFLPVEESEESGENSSTKRKVSFQFVGEWNFEFPYTTESVLLIDDKPIKLPQVKITRSNGVLGSWVIQDTESMVDLVFTPKSDNHRRLSIFILRTDYHTIYGNFDGEIVTPEGQKLQIKGFSGIGSKYLLREGF